LVGSCHPTEAASKVRKPLIMPNYLPSGKQPILKKHIFIYSISVFTFLTLGWMVYAFFGHSWIQTLYDRNRDLAFFEVQFEGPGPRPLKDCLQQIDKLVYQTLLWTTALLALSIYLICILKERRKWQNLIMNFVFFSLSTLSAIGVTELILWCYLPVGLESITRDHYRPSRNLYLVYEPIPMSGEFNSDGFRGRSYSKEKPKGVYRILVIGDSLVYGLGVSAEETYVKKLEEKLNARFRGIKKFEVINFGVSGYQTFQIIERLKQKGLSYHPDFIIYGYCLNDVAVHKNGEFDFFSDPVNHRVDSILSLAGETKHFLLKSQMVRHGLLIVKRIKKQKQTSEAESFPPLGDTDRKIKPSVFNLYRLYVDNLQKGKFLDQEPWIRYYAQYANTDQFALWNASVNKFSEICHHRNLGCLVLMTPLIYDYVIYDYQGLHEFIRAVFSEYAIETLDLQEMFSRYRAEEVRLYRDTLHPNRAGHELIAEALYQYLKDKVSI